MSNARTGGGASPAPVALPTAVGTPVYTGFVDTHTAPSDARTGATLGIDVPNLNAAQLPDGARVTYAFEHSADGQSFIAIPGVPPAAIQSGIDGEGAGEFVPTVPLSQNTLRFLRLAIVTSNGAGDCSDAFAALHFSF